MTINYLKLDNWYLRSLLGNNYCLEKRISRHRFFQLFIDDNNKILPPANLADKSILLIVNGNDVPLNTVDSMFKGTVTEILEEVKCYE